jgi:hypothetical protein
MARLTGENIEHYTSGSGSNSGYFSLKDDKDTARVRFLYEKAEEVEGYTVHKVQVGERERYVNCLVEEGGSPADCPFCKAKFPKFAKLFIPLYNEDADQLQIWERGQKFYGTISGLCARYPNLVSRTFDIERNGKKGEQTTTYSVYPVGDADGTTVQDILDDLGIEKLPNPLGTSVLNKSADDMEYYVEHGDFPQAENPPMRRRGGSEDTPRRGRRDRF